YFGHMGDYRCPQCGTHRPQPMIAAERVELAGLQGSGFALRTPAGTAQVRTVLPGVYNIHNVLAAAACCLQLGVPLQTVARGVETFAPRAPPSAGRSEEHTSELQSRFDLVCRLLLEKKNIKRFCYLILYLLNTNL